MLCFYLLCVALKPSCWIFRLHFCSHQSRLTALLCHPHVTFSFRPSPSTISKALMKADKLFLKPHGTTLYWYTRLPNWKLVHFLEDLCNGTWRKALLRSMVVIYFDPWNLCSNSFMRSTFTLSGTISAFTLRASIQILIPFPGLSTRVSGFT